MPAGDYVKTTALIGAVHGTNTNDVVSTPIRLHGYTVLNNSGAAVSLAYSHITNGLFGFSYPAGVTHVPTYGQRFDRLYAWTSDTNSSVLFHYESAT